MEQIRLQCLCPVKPKNISGTSKIKTKRGETFGSKCWLLVNKYIAQKFVINKFTLKGTLMQIWKSPYMFVFIQK